LTSFGVVLESIEEGNKDQNDDDEASTEDNDNPDFETLSTQFASATLYRT
jgi:hypothetical protein